LRQIRQGRDTASIHAIARDCRPMAVSGKNPPMVELELPPGYIFHCERLNQPEALAILARCAEECFGIAVRFHAHLAGTEAATDGARAA
jgi:hypothetical protein